MPTRKELTAARRSIDEIKEYMGADILMYQEIDDLAEAVTRKGEHNIDRPCMACLDGKYITGDVDEKKMDKILYGSQDSGDVNMFFFHQWSTPPFILISFCRYIYYSSE